MVLLVVYVLCGLAITSEAKLPSYITPCKKSELSSCAVKNSAKIFQYLMKGDPSLKLPPMDPFRMRRMDIIDSPEKKIHINLTFTDMVAVGIGNSKLLEYKLDEKKRQISYTYEVPKIELNGNYKINGKILVLPIVGEGPCQIITENIKISQFIDYKLKKVKGKEYMELTGFSFKSSAGLMKFNMENLFNGNKNLGDNMNRVLNENWKDLAHQFGDEILTNIVTDHKDYFHLLYTTTPFNEIFLD